MSHLVVQLCCRRCRRRRPCRLDASRRLFSTRLDASSVVVVVVVVLSLPYRQLRKDTRSIVVVVAAVVVVVLSTRRFATSFPFLTRLDVSSVVVVVVVVCLLSFEDGCVKTRTLFVFVAVVVVVVLSTRRLGRLPFLDVTRRVLRPRLRRRCCL